MKFLIPLFLFLLPFNSWSQELPPFLNFEPNTYAAGNQNWMISQAGNGNIYFANGMGLLEFTGEEWNLYPVPNNTIVRSVKAVGEKIFTGAYMELGYWQRSEMGILEYTSLLPQLSDAVHDGEQFWHIETVPGFVVFQSFEGLYLYNLEKENISRISTIQGDFISNLFEVEGTIYYQVAEKGLLSLQHGKSDPIIDSEMLQDLAIIHLFEREGILHLITESGEFFRWNGQSLIQYNEHITETLSGTNVFSALAFPNGEIALGTVAQGLFHVSEQGVLHHFDQQNGLLNNTILALFLDESGNLWTGLDNGISTIQLNSSIELFEDRNGQLGSVYSSFQTEDLLYVGTNQGLYFRENGTKNFELIPGTSGQVWSLQELDGVLFCGHNSGTFVVEGKEVRKISDRFGTWLVKKLSESYYIQGHYNGLSFLKKEGDNYTDLPLLPNFPHSSRYIVPASNGVVWVGNEHKGAYRLRLNETLRSISETKNYTFPGRSGITSSIFELSDTLYYSSRKEILQYSPAKDKFLIENQLNSTIEGLNRISGRILKTGKDEIWGFEANSIFKVEKALLRSGYRVKRIFLPKELEAIPLGNENISKLNNGHYLLGTAKGYVIFDMPQETEEELNMRIDRVSTWALDQPPNPVALGGEETVFPHRANNISFQFSIPEHLVFPEAFYSYRLLGQSEVWSEWSKNSRVSFENLGFGDYEFQVRGMVGNKSTAVQSFHFEIGRPWYLSWPALVFYVLLFILLLFMINKVNQRRHVKLNLEKERTLQMKHLKAEQEIIKLQNQQLEQNMSAKNKELADSMMNLIQKNEFLSKIKEQLKNTSDPTQIKAVIKVIDKEISEEDNWNLFKEAFTNADKDFFKKIKALHPDLTSNDLRLCAYLRLNLSSKEIAPLLNISVKSVEIKRYRLRKKMNLPRKKQLTDYILEV